MRRPSCAWHAGRPVAWFLLSRRHAVSAPGWPNSRPRVHPRLAGSTRQPPRGPPWRVPRKPASLHKFSPRRVNPPHRLRHGHAAGDRDAELTSCLLLHTTITRRRPSVSHYVVRQCHYWSTDTRDETLLFDATAHAAGCPFGKITTTGRRRLGKKKRRGWSLPIPPVSRVNRS